MTRRALFGLAFSAAAKEPEDALPDLTRSERFCNAWNSYVRYMQFRLPVGKARAQAVRMWHDVVREFHEFARVP